MKLPAGDAGDLAGVLFPPGVALLLFFGLFTGVAGRGSESIACETERLLAERVSRLGLPTLILKIRSGGVGITASKSLGRQFLKFLGLGRK